MSPEFYAIIGVGASLAGLMVGIAGVLLYFIIQANRRIDDQGQRIDRLEDTLTQRTDRLENTLTQRIDRVEDTLTQRIDRLEDTFIQRMNRLEDKVDRLIEQAHSLDVRVSKLEWLAENMADFRHEQAQLESSEAG